MASTGWPAYIYLPLWARGWPVSFSTRAMGVVVVVTAIFFFFFFDLPWRSG